MILLIGSTLFILFFVSHVILWKIKLPQKQKTTLLILSVVILTMGLVSLKVGNNIYPEIFSSVTPSYIVEYLHIGLFFMVLVFFYISIYVAIEADSPSLKMIIKIHESGINGLAREKLIKNFEGEKFLRYRVNYLLEDNMLAFDGKHYTLTARGQGFLRICFYWRKILGMVNDVG